MCSVHHNQQLHLPESNSQLGLSLDTTDTCIVHKQTNRDCASRATTTLTTQPHQACSTNREKNNKDAATRQQAGRNNLVNMGRWTKLVTLLDLCVSSQHSPNTVTRLSLNSIGHGGRCKYGCYGMFISTPSHLQTVRLAARCLLEQHT